MVLTVAVRAPRIGGTREFAPRIDMRGRVHERGTAIPLALAPTHPELDGIGDSERENDTSLARAGDRRSCAQAIAVTRR